MHVELENHILIQLYDHNTGLSVTCTCTCKNPGIKPPTREPTVYMYMYMYVLYVAMKVLNNRRTFRLFY